MNLLLFAPEYRPNLSSMIRTAEFYGFKQIYIYDKNDLMKPPTNKKGRADMAHMAKVWTAGAIDHIEIIRIDNISTFLKHYHGRTVATIVNESATHLSDFQFQSEDLRLDLTDTNSQVSVTQIGELVERTVINDEDFDRYCIGYCYNNILPTNRFRLDRYFC